VQLLRGNEDEDNPQAEAGWGLIAEFLHNVRKTLTKD